MRLTKLEVLALSKALHSLGLSSSQKDDTTSTTLYELSKKVDSFLLMGEDVEDAPKTPDSGVFDSFVTGQRLHELEKAEIEAPSGLLEFELVRPKERTPFSRVDLLLDGACVVGDVSEIRRTKKEIVVRSFSNRNLTSRFTVGKLPISWKKTFPVGTRVGVEA